MTREEATIKLTRLKNKFLDEYVDYDGTASAFDMAIEALAKMEAIQRVIDMPLLWEQDDRRRYAKVVDIVRKDLTQEVEL